MTTRLEVIASLDSYAAGVGAYAREQQRLADQAIIDGLNTQVTSLQTLVSELTRNNDDLSVEVDALRATILDLEAQIVALQARIDELENPDPEPEPVETIEYTDFTTHWAGKWFGSTSYRGKGLDKTIVQVKPLSSTRGPAVRALTSGQSNLCNVMRFGGLDSANTVLNFDIGQFNIRGTDQGHLYNGMVVGYSKNAKIHDIKITGIPGNSSTPPGETFLFGVWRADAHEVNNMVLDSRNSAGENVGATLYGVNSCVGGVARNLKANYAKYGFSAALWDSKDLLFEDCDFRFSRKAINIEQSRGGYYKFVRCDFRGLTGAAYVAQVSSTLANSNVTFEDCIFDNDLCQVRVYPGLSGNKQLSGSIRRIVNGVDVTSDTAKFKIITTG